MEIDRFYMEHIHKKFKCYMANPMIATQRDGLVILRTRLLIMILWNKH